MAATKFESVSERFTYAIAVLTGPQPIQERVSAAFEFLRPLRQYEIPDVIRDEFLQLQARDIANGADENEAHAIASKLVWLYFLAAQDAVAASRRKRAA